MCSINFNELERRQRFLLSQEQMKANQDLLVVLFLREHYKISCGLLTAEELEEKKQEFIQDQDDEDIYERDLFYRFRGFICNSWIYRFDCVNDTRTDEDISFEKWSIKKSVELGFPCPNPRRNLAGDKAFEDKKYDDILFWWFVNWTENIKTLFEFLECDATTHREYLLILEARLDTKKDLLEKELRELEEQEAQQNEQELLRQLEQEEHKPTPKTSKKKKEKKIKEPTNPHKEFVSIAKDIWKKNPAWTKWEKENKK
jgi:hypothetical protein